MSSEPRDMFIAPAGVTTTAQWASWWLTSKLRGPILDMLDLGLTNVPRPSFLTDPAWSPADLGAVAKAQIARFGTLLEQAVLAGT